MKSFEVVSIPGLSSFAEVEALQYHLLDQRIQDEIPDTLIFCEHKPVITRGRGLQRTAARKAANLFAEENGGVEERAKPLMFIPPGTDYHEISRGGDLTWHGPGQLVVYPIIKLGGEGALGAHIGQTVNGYIRFLENTVIDLLAPLGVKASSKPDGSGVWIDTHKVLSVGIALRKWVTYHGIALNIVNDPNGFRSFDPCGFNPEVMTRLCDQPEIPRELLDANWRARFESLMIESLGRVKS